MKVKPHVHTGPRQTVSNVKFCVCPHVPVGWATEVSLHVGGDCLLDVGVLWGDLIRGNTAGHPSHLACAYPTCTSQHGPPGRACTRPPVHPTLCDTNLRMSQEAKGTRCCGARQFCDASCFCWAAGLALAHGQGLVARSRTTPARFVGLCRCYDKPRRGCLGV